MSALPVAATSMEGKTCLVTGATSGIGAVTAEVLARAGATVIVVGRNPERCRATTANLREVAGRAEEPIVADLSSQAEIRRLAATVLERYPRLDVLLNNAGGVFNRRLVSADGIEMTWALNHLNYFLLTNLLLDRIRSSAPARVVSVASDAHKAARGIDFDDVEGKRRYGAMRAYCQSKLANVLFTFELARRLEGTGVTANCVHPGFVNSSFFNDKGPLAAFLKFWAGVPFIGLTPEAGARTSVHVATSPEGGQVTGRYFEKCHPAASSRASLDTEAARRLWRLSEEMTGLPVTA
jgi:NAD(P)-dependent dehydrogenase (short-subunit alcohol dehydrogenase family)